MKNFLIQLAIAVLAIGFFSSCKEEKSVKVGVSIGPMHERWEKDRDFLKKSLETRGAQVIMKLAQNDESVQRQQVLDLIKSKIDVLIIVAINSETAGTLVNEGKKNGIKVIAYDRLIKNCELDFYLSFDNIKVGELQADYLSRIAPNGKYAILGGSPNDNNSILLRLGHLNILQPLITRKDIEIVLDKNVDNWDANVAYTIVSNFLKESKELDAIVSSNDLISEGVCRALKEYEMCGKILVSGQDAESLACRRIMEGRQTMTVYKYVESLANAAANIAMVLAKNDELPYSQTTINNGKMMVPSIQLPNMIQVTKENMRMTVVADGYIDEKTVFDGL